MVVRQWLRSAKVHLSKGDPVAIAEEPTPIDIYFSSSFRATS